MSNELNELFARIDEIKSKIYIHNDDATHKTLQRMVVLLGDCKAALSQQEAVVPSDCADKYIPVSREAVDWLKEKFPALCVKSGMCEQIGGRLYTKTISSTHPQPQKVESKVPQSVEVWIDDLEDAAVGYVTGAPEAAKELARTASKNLRTFMAGKVLVPVEPTQHMLHEAYDCHMMELPFSQGSMHKLAEDIYRAMLTASKEGV